MSEVKPKITRACTVEASCGYSHFLSAFWENAVKIHYHYDFTIAQPLLINILRLMSMWPPRYENPLPEASQIKEIKGTPEYTRRLATPNKVNFSNLV